MLLKDFRPYYNSNETDKFYNIIWIVFQSDDGGWLYFSGYFCPLELSSNPKGTEPNTHFTHLVGQLYNFVYA